MSLVGQKQYETGDRVRYGWNYGEVVNTSTNGFTTIKLDNGETKIVKTASLSDCLWSLEKQITGLESEIKGYEAKMAKYKAMYSSSNTTIAETRREIGSLLGRAGVSSEEELTGKKYKDYTRLDNELSFAKAEKRESGNGIRRTALTLGSLFGDRGSLQSMKIIAQRMFA